MSIHVFRPKVKTASVRAAQLTADSVASVVSWTGGKQVKEIDPEDSEKTMVGINIPTLDGNVRASEGDYVVQHIETGRFEVWLAEEFEQTYERPTRG